MLNATRKATLASAENSCYRKEVRVEKEKVEALEEQVGVAEARAGKLEQVGVAEARDGKLEQEKNEALKRAKSAERELEKMKKEEKRKLKVADAKGYQAGFDRKGD